MVQKKHTKCQLWAINSFLIILFLCLLSKKDQRNPYDSALRFYDSKIGKFIKADTQIPDLKNPLDFNRYSYVRNTPFEFSDPSGHSPQDPSDEESFIQTLVLNTIDMVFDTAEYALQGSLLFQSDEVAQIINNPNASTTDVAKVTGLFFLTALTPNPKGGGNKLGKPSKSVSGEIIGHVDSGVVRGGKHIKDVLTPKEYRRWKKRRAKRAAQRMKEHVEDLRNPEPYAPPKERHGPFKRLRSYERQAEHLVEDILDAVDSALYLQQHFGIQRVKASQAAIPKLRKAAQRMGWDIEVSREPVAFEDLAKGKLRKVGITITKPNALPFNALFDERWTEGNVRVRLRKEMKKQKKRTEHEQKD